MSTPPNSANSSPTSLIRERVIVTAENRVFQDALDRGLITQAQYDEAMGYQNARLQDTQGAPPTAKPTPETVEYMKGQRFFTEVGHPELVGKYQAPDVPPGYDVKDFQVTQEKISGPTGSETKATFSYVLAPKVTPEAAAFYTKIGRPDLAKTYGVPDIPAGYEVYSVKEVGGYPSTRPAMSTAEAMGQKSLEFTLVPEIKFVQDVPAGVSGPVLIEPRTPTAQEKKELRSRWLRGEDISASSALETRAAAGLTLGVGVVAPIVTAPTLALGAVQIAGAVAAPVVGQALKTAVKGESLTASEAIFLSGAGVAIGGAGYALGRSGVIQRGGQRAYEKLFPERALYNRVVLEESLSKGQGGTGAPVGSQSWIDQVKAKVSPNTALRSTYERAVVEPNKAATIGTPRTSDLDVLNLGSKGRQSTAQWVQQTQIKQAPRVKAGMKPLPVQLKAWETNLKVTSGQAAKAVTLTPVFNFTPISLTPKTTSTAKTTAKTTTSQALQFTASIPRTSADVSFMGQQTKNPFTQFGGKPFYGYRTPRIMEEDVVLSYPEQSPISHPVIMSKPDVLQGSKTDILQGVNTRQLLDQGQKLGQIQRQDQRQLFDMRQVLRDIQGTFTGIGTVQDVGTIGDVQTIRDTVQDLVQDVTTIQLTDQQQVSRNLTRGFNLPEAFNIGGGSSFTPKFFGGAGRQKRTYPIVTGADFLAAWTGAGKSKKATHKHKKHKTGGRKK